MFLRTVPVFFFLHDLPAFGVWSSGVLLVRSSVRVSVCHEKFDVAF